MDHVYCRIIACLVVWGMVAVSPVPAASKPTNDAPPPDQVAGLAPLIAPPEVPAGSSRGLTSWDLQAGRYYATTSPVWVQAEYLLWWITPNTLPPLVTTSDPGTDLGDAGVLGLPTTHVLFGDRRVDGGPRSGFRTSLGIRLGHWFDAWMDAELAFDYLWLGDGQSSGDFRTTSLGDVILARPFFNAEWEVADAQLTAFPELLAGTIEVETASQLRGAGASFRRIWKQGTRGRLDWLVGYRYLELQEQLSVRETSVAWDDGGRWDSLDDFRCWNEFHGLDLGLEYWTQVRGWTVELLMKVAVGGLARTVDIRGMTTYRDPGGERFVGDGALLALPSNMGRHQSSQLAPLPELNVKLRRPLTHHLVLTLGYSAMVMEGVLRTGDQIDLTVNPAQTAPARPAVPMKSSSLWVHGFQVGLEW